MRNTRELWREQLKAMTTKLERAIAEPIQALCPVSSTKKANEMPVNTECSITVHRRRASSTTTEEKRAAMAGTLDHDVAPVELFYTATVRWRGHIRVFRAENRLSAFKQASAYLFEKFGEHHEISN